ncbi:MAG: type II 3-dehydroquinate dehydratase [Pseudomonadota bacterium]|nr:type II 3-dehydroquinate dehydratase [Pseudomonadota bacterium]
MSSKTKILIINGPNLNMLGVREPEIYGRVSLDEISHICVSHASTLHAELDFRQSNSETEIIGWLHTARDNVDGVIINPAAFTHTSIAILDAVILTELPVIEVHLSNIFKRESFRTTSYISAGATGIITGFGAMGYKMAIDAMLNLICSEVEA